MNENIDHNFDENLRKIAEKHTEPLWEEAWPAMLEKLEKKDKKGVFYYWKYAAAIIVMIGVGYLANIWFENNRKSETTAIQVIEDAQVVAKSENTKTTSSVADIKTPEIKKSQDFNLESSENISTISKKEVPKTENINSKFDLKFTNSLNKKLVKNSKVFKPAYKSDVKLYDATEQKIDMVQSPYTPSSETKDVINAEEKPNNQSELTEKEVSKNDELLTKTEETKIENIETNDSDADTVIVSMEETKIDEQQLSLENESKKEPKTYNNLPRLSFNFGYSPDYSTTRFKEMGKLGTNFQAILGLRISKKLHLKAGIIQSTKFYNAAAADYIWPSSWATPSSKLVQINASCKILDFPVNLAYEFKRTKNVAFFGSLGITSYKMNKEAYVYNYENNANQGLKKKWEGNNTGTISASNLNLSVGIERKINNLFAIQLEPFFKSPLKQIGKGKVMLYSSGVFMNVKVTPFKKRN